MDPVRILISDDHPLTRIGIRYCLSNRNNITIVGEVWDTNSLIEKSTQLKPDIILLDVFMVGFSIKEIIGILQERCPEAKIIILSDYEDEIYIRDSISMGVWGYVFKDEEIETIINSIQTVIQGNKWFSQKVLQAMAALLSSNFPISSDGMLTPREMDAFQLLGKGMSNEQIAGELHISLRTACFHIENILKKLDVHSRAEAIIKGVKLKLINI